MSMMLAKIGGFMGYCDMRFLDSDSDQTEDDETVSEKELGMID